MKSLGTTNLKATNPKIGKNYIQSNLLLFLITWHRYYRCTHSTTNGANNCAWRSLCLSSASPKETMWGHPKHCNSWTGGHFVCACVNRGCWSATEALSVNCLRSVPAFSGCFLELNDVHWMLRSTNMLFKVSRYFYDESEFIVDSL